MTKRLLQYFMVLSALGLSLTSRATEHPDSLLQAYYVHCRDYMRTPEIVPLCDTLFRMAEAQGDRNMQSTAMAFVADFYYYKNQLDSLKASMQRIELFARQYDMPKPFYFAWNHLITLYIKTGSYTLAQYELDKLIDRAERDDYKFGIGSAYYNLGNIYLLRGVNATAADHYRQAANYILENNLEQYTLTTIYGQLSAALCNMGQYTEALQAIDDAEKYTPNAQQNGMCYWFDGDRAAIIAKMGDSARALKLLQNLEQNKPTFYPDIQLQKLRMTIYESLGMHNEAIKAADTLIQAHINLGDSETYYSSILETKAGILAGMGRYRDAYDQLQHFVVRYKEKVSKEGENTLAEFATLMGVEQLNREKAELEKQTQEERLNRTYLIIAALLCILLLAALSIITQRRLNRKLARAKRAAEESNHMKSIFIRSITHEVNTPLNAIVGFAELAAADTTEPGERQGYVDIIHENSNHLQKLIDDTLYIADLESSDSEPTIESTDINACCRHALHNVAHRQDKGVEIHFHPTDEALFAEVSKPHFIKVVTELLHNAITFTEKGSIDLHCGITEDARTLVVSVTDTGGGIPAAEAEHIFERFVKLNSFSQGMGLGLFVCRLIADRLQGGIRLDTNYTQGARFIFTLPMEKIN